jgi:hypothetical protein
MKLTQFRSHQSDPKLLQSLSARSQRRRNMSEQSLFGCVAFPSRPEKSRDANRCQSVLGRLYRGSSGTVSISSL